MPSAAQNAAQNALTQVVGSFIDAKDFLEEQVEIRDGTRTQVQNIKTDIKEYSQGSIKTFEIVKVGEENGITVVTARAVVRVEELTNYFKGIVGGERPIEGTSLFAQAATKSQQNKDKIEILKDNVLNPLGSDLIIFEISKPKIYNTEELGLEWKELMKKRGAPYFADLLSSFEGKKWDGSVIDRMSSSFGKENLYVFDIVAKINDEFVVNARKSLDGISRGAKIIRSGMNIHSVSEALKKNAKQDDFFVLIHDGKSSDLVMASSKQFMNDERIRHWGLEMINREIIASIRSFPFISYAVGDVTSHLNYSCGEQRAHPVRSSGQVNISEDPLIVELSDGEGNILQEAIVGSNPLRAVALPSDYSANFFDSNISQVGDVTPAWILYKPICPESFRGLASISGLAIFKQRNFKLIVAIDQENLKKIKKITLRIENSKSENEPK